MIQTSWRSNKITDTCWEVKHYMGWIGLGITNWNRSKGKSSFFSCNIDKKKFQIFKTNSPATERGSSDVSVWRYSQRRGKKKNRRFLYDDEVLVFQYRKRRLDMAATEFSGGKIESASNVRITFLIRSSTLFRPLSSATGKLSIIGWP
jgi:hypothetical protein